MFLVLTDIRKPNPYNNMTLEGNAELDQVLFQWRQLFDASIIIINCLIAYAIKYVTCLHYNNTTSVLCA